jgi:hypothetical protein
MFHCEAQRLTMFPPRCEQLLQWSPSRVYNLEDYKQQKLWMKM